MYRGVEEMVNDFHDRLAIARQPTVLFFHLPDPKRQEDCLTEASGSIDDGGPIVVGGDGTILTLHRLLPTDKTFLLLFP
jgi:NAD kinase